MNRWIDYMIASLAVFAATELRAVDRYVAWGNAANADTPFTNWATATTNIQDAVDVSVDNDVIWVAPGTYSVPTNPGVGYKGETNVVTISDLSLTLRSSNGVPDETIIDGGDRYRGIYPYPGSGERILIDGFTISNCWATNGAAIFIRAQSTRTVVVQNCDIEYNTAHSYGGGVFVWQPSDNAVSLDYTFSNCVFQGNLVTNGTAGALYDGVRGGAGKREHIVDCEIIGNVATNGGSAATGGFHLNSTTDALIENCVFRGNRTGMGGDLGRAGAIYNRNGNATIRGCLIYDNQGDWGAGIYMGKNCDTFIENCTITANTGYGVRAKEPEADTWFYNTIVYNDDVFDRGTQVFTNCCLDPAFEQWTDGVNTITNDPQFVDADNDNYRLTTGSPCRNTGTNQAWMSSALDLDENPRLDSRIVDMGCYEYVTYGTSIMVQ